MIKFLVKQQKIETLEREVIASDQIAFVNIRFVFDGDWKKFHKVVQFTQCDDTYNRVLGYDGTSCLLPSELHEGTVKMSVFGYDMENTAGLRATTVPVTLHIRPSGFVGDDVDIPPTPDLYAQLLKQIDGVGRGKSAYEIAVDHGYIGTEDEWLESLKAISDLSDYVTKEQLADITTPDLSDYVTKEQLNDTELSIRESMIPLHRELHSHTNFAVLNQITAPFTTADKEKLDEISDFQQFMDSTKYEIQTLTEEIGNFSRTAHLHNNKAVLDAITEEMLDDIASISQPTDRHPNLATLNSITDSHVERWELAYTSAMNLNERVSVNEGVFERFKTEILHDMQNTKSAVTDIYTRLSAVEEMLSDVESALGYIVEV